MIVAGNTEVDVEPYRPWRFGDPYRDIEFAAAAAREVYRYYYRLRYPLDVSQAGRPQRLCSLHGRLQEPVPCSARRTAGSAPTTSIRPALEAGGRDQRGFGWSRPPYSTALVAASTRRYARAPASST